MKIICHETIESAWTAADAWRDMSEQNPMLSPEWLLTWWKYFGENHQLLLLECKDDDGKTVGIAPFYMQRDFGSISIRSLGCGEVCTDYISVLSEKDFESTVAIEVAMYLADFCTKQTLAFSTCLTLEAVDRGSSWARTFCDTTVSLGYQNWIQPIASSFRIELPKTMSEYINSLGASAKRKGKKLLAQIRSGAVRYKTSDETGSVLNRLVKLQELHQARRKELNQAGCFASNRFEGFLFEAVDLLSQRGLARIDSCEMDGKTVATHLVLKGNDTLFMYQSGIDPVNMKVEPGHLLTIASIDRAIVSGNRFYDTLRGDEKYKTYWGSKAVALSTIHCRPPHLLSQVTSFSHYRYWQLKQAAKRILKCSVAR